MEALGEFRLRESQGGARHTDLAGLEAAVEAYVGHVESSGSALMAISSFFTSVAPAYEDEPGAFGPQGVDRGVDPVIDGSDGLEAFLAVDFARCRQNDMGGFVEDLLSEGERKSVPLPVCFVSAGSRSGGMAGALRKYRSWSISAMPLRAGDGLLHVRARDGAAPFLGARHQDSACGVSWRGAAKCCHTGQG